MNKTLHLKREWANKEGHKYPQGLSYDLVNWTDGDLAQLNSCLNVFKEKSNGEFDFYIGEYGLFGDDLLKSDAPEGFYPAVDKARKEAQNVEERETV